MSIRMFWAATLIAYSAVTVLGQISSHEQEPVASLVTVEQQERQTAAAAAATNPRSIASCSSICTGFSTSSGNLYFTSFDNNEFGPASASFYRASKTGTPGGEGLLHQETLSGVGSFGRPVWANVNGTYYGYFSARYNSGGVETFQIKRVPLGGGGAAILAYLPRAINSLETDGSSLFWADSSGIRSMPIGGGAIQNLVSFHVTVRLGIRLDFNYLYYSVGPDIRRIPKAGGTSTTLVTAPDVVTSFSVNTGPFTTIFWGEQGGAVRSRGLFGIYTYQNPIAGRSAGFAGFDGTRVLWSDCTNPGGSYCSIKTKTGSSPATTVFSGGAVADLQWDPVSMYWHDYSSIKRYVH